ncbi:hypothetical protein DICPUDRAFT_40793 [Dictyostelium purpureum]|uniref:Peptidase S53 domain-containing protein n=1 Tax=Dictyostelium purpureum TaxID=5786 RepID=F0ZYU4_DICPU|nr:uncharacterized protein DICPUDRAFT_40793 [Dictyostelium purpureum]EGC30880.1 hypothetical protein DICPUDRAFT_40793 [Dictyostelium purpureum]|eukprot:XP_003292585.1 hypothetical protein DICPUDRAFT_40793 [Dictyostelium purpureum]
MKSKIFILFILNFIFSIGFSSNVYNSNIKLTTIANVETFPNRFLKIGDSKQSETIQFKILLKQKNLNILEDKFWDISSPKSENYGKFLNEKEIDSIIAPNEEDIQDVLNWLVDNEIEKNGITCYSDYIKVEASVKKASKLFNTKFSDYISTRTLNRRIRIDGPAWVPESISEKIHLILGLSDFIEDHKKTKLNINRNLKDDSMLITPDVIRKYYGVSDEIGTNLSNIQSVGSQHSVYSEGALEYFEQQYNLNPSRIITNNMENCLPGGCDQLEPNIDIQYLSSMGNNITTLYYQLTYDEWVLDWALNVQSFVPFPLVSSLSYGFGEFDVCAVVPNNCSSLGIDSVGYINRTNIEFQKLGLRGMSILVSSGDEGCLGFYSSSGNCPLDTSNYCPLGGCKYTTTFCPSITISLSNGSECFFPMGYGNDTCFNLFLNSNYSDSINNFIESNNDDQCTTTIDRDSRNNPHFYTSCSCDSLIPYYDEELELKIISFEFDPEAGRLFDLEFPGSSPYITSVGATQILSMTEPEIVCSITTGAIIVSGGGFSATQPQPSYQASAVSKYLENGASTLPPSYSFNPSNRAVPDITLAGHSYSIANSVNQSSNECPCELSSVDGTSCSAPSAGGIFSLINDHLLNSNRSPLGFLNPLLYQAAIEQPNVFNDITVGNIKCNGVYCCEYGYSATPGYDCASGLGSINYQNLKDYILLIKK